MSHFYGTLQGARGRATRTGSKSSGITVQAAGWHGAIEVSVHNAVAGHDEFTVSLIPWQGSGGSRRELAHGELNANSVRQTVIEQRPTKEPDMVEGVLEPLVDKHDLTHVVAGLALLCFEKAAHIRSAWQDEALAKTWEANGKRIERLAEALK